MVDKRAFHSHFLSILATIVGILDFEQDQFRQSISGFFLVVVCLGGFVFVFCSLETYRQKVLTIYVMKSLQCFYCFRFSLSLTHLWMVTRLFFLFFPMLCVSPRLQIHHGLKPWGWPEQPSISVTHPGGFFNHKELLWDLQFYWVLVYISSPGPHTT